jgi:hypothetical protein
VQLTSIITGWLVLPVALSRLYPVIHHPGTTRRHVRLLACLAVVAALISLIAGVVLVDRYGWLLVGWRALVLLVVLAVARRAITRTASPNTALRANSAGVRGLHSGLGEPTGCGAGPPWTVGDER